MEERRKPNKNSEKPIMVGKINLPDLITLLRSQGISSFELNDMGPTHLKITFGDRAWLANPVIQTDDTADMDAKISQLQNMDDEELLYYSSK